MKKTRKILSLILTMVMFFSVANTVFSASTDASNELAGKKVEIAFLIDASGSMSPYIEKVKENVEEMARFFESSGVNLRMAVVRFGSTTDGVRANVLKIRGSSWHTNTAQLVETLENIPADGGTEALSDAIGDILNKDPATNITNIHWSSDAFKFAFVLTNDFDSGVEGKEYNDYGYETLNSTIPDLQVKQIPVTIVTGQQYFSRYEKITSETNGRLYDINSPDYLQMLLDYAKECMGITLKPKKAIYILPGYLGSELYDGEGTDAKKLFVNIISNSGIWSIEDKLKFINQVDGSPRNTIFVNAKDDYGVRDTYKDLVNRLKKEFDFSNGGDYDVKFFPYNWVGDLNDSVKKLEYDINRNGYEKVVFVTHSTGGLLASAYVAQGSENKRKVEKAVLIAAPLYGTYASLFPIERGDSKKLFKDFGSIITDAGTWNEWVKAWAYNSPTTYQLLPSEEYLQHYPLIDKGGWGDGEKQITTASGFYDVLNQSENINTNLTNGNNRSHKYFRETVLKKNIADTWSLSSLQEIDVTLICTKNGHNTPTHAIYKEPLFGEHRVLKDIEYTKEGDGTVTYFSASAQNSFNTNSLFKDVEDNFTSNHTDLVSDSAVLNTVCNKIKSVSVAGNHGGGGRSIGYMDTTNGAGMSEQIKIRYECDDVVTATVYNSSDKVVAEATGGNYTGFENDLIYDNFAENETITDASIYIPNQDYKVVFTCGDSSGKNIEFTSEVSTLTIDGWKDLSVKSTISKTSRSGVILSLDGTINTINNKTLTNAVKGEIIERYTDWHLPSDVKVNLNDVQKIKLEGSEATKAADSLSWASSNPNIIDVSSNGTITAKGYGKAIISVSNGNKIESTEIAVINNATSVVLDDIPMIIGERTLIRPVFTPANSTETDLKYDLSQSGIIEIDESGVIHALKAGTVIVTGKTSYGVQDSFVVTVEDTTNYAVESIEILPSTISVESGKTTAFNVKFTPENASNKDLNWYIEDESLCIVSKLNGEFAITGLSSGTTKIVAISVDGGYTAEATVHVSSGHTITFETNGGNTITPVTVSDGGILSAPAAPTKPNHVFSGWYTDPALTSPYNFLSKVNSSFTLYAKWLYADSSKIILTIGQKDAIVFGKLQTNDVAPKIVNGRTMLPIRFVAEALGAEVLWNALEPNKVIITNGSTIINVFVGSNYASVNRVRKELDCVSFEENNRTYLPLRFISETLGASVEWLGDTQQIIITK